MHRTFAHRLATLVSVFLLCAAVRAADGSFEVLRAESRSDAGIWLVDARVNMELSDEARQALTNGVVLTLEYQFEVTRRIKFWPDEQVAQQVRRLQLRYLSLSDRYMVEYPATGEQKNYATLSAALREAGELNGYPLIEVVRLIPGERYRFAMRVVLDQDELPGPLQMLTFWRSDYSLGSNWYRWKPAR